MDKYLSKDILLAYTELTDTKVDMAVSKSIERVLDSIADLKGGMDQRFSDINHRFVHLENGLEKRFTAVDHRVNSTRNSLRSLNRVITQVRTGFIENCIRAVWAGISVAIVYSVSHLYLLLFK